MGVPRGIGRRDLLMGAAVAGGALPYAATAAPAHWPDVLFLAQAGGGPRAKCTFNPHDRRYLGTLWLSLRDELDQYQVTIRLDQVRDDAVRVNLFLHTGVQPIPRRTRPIELVFPPVIANTTEALGLLLVAYEMLPPADVSRDAIWKFGNTPVCSVLLERT